MTTVSLKSLHLDGNEGGHVSRFVPVRKTV